MYAICLPISSCLIFLCDSGKHTRLLSDTTTSPRFCVTVCVAPSSIIAFLPNTSLSARIRSGTVRDRQTINTRATRTGAILEHPPGVCFPCADGVRVGLLTAGIVLKTIDSRSVVTASPTRFICNTDTPLSKVRYSAEPVGVSSLSRLNMLNASSFEDALRAFMALYQLPLLALSAVVTYVAFGRRRKPGLEKYYSPHHVPLPRRKLDDGASEEETLISLLKRKLGTVFGPDAGFVSVPWLPR